MSKIGYTLWTILVALFATVLPCFAESQPVDYDFNDPFRDPTDYEFAQDEREDKEFFHLGRFLMIGADAGVGIFTGGLGTSIEPALYVGGKLSYFFDKQLTFEVGVHYSSHLDRVQPSTAQLVEIDTSILYLTGGFRFYFDTQNAPRAIAVANPFIAFGGGAYVRKQKVNTAEGVNVDRSNLKSTNYGIYAGLGVEFRIYRRHIYLGLDVRYHLVFFPDEDDTLGNTVESGSRGGDLFTPAVSLTYNF